MALSDAALTKLTTVNRRLGFTAGQDVSRDELIEELIEEVSAEFAQATGRQFYNKSDHVEKVRGYGDHRILVKEHLPITSISSIVYDDGEDTTTLDSASYEIEDATAGIIRKVSGRFRFTSRGKYGTRYVRYHGTEEALIKVTYTGGYITPQQAHDDATTRNMPRDVEAAIVARVIEQYRNKDRDTAITRKRLGNATIEWSGFEEGQISPAEKRWKEVVARYRRWGFA